MKLPTLSLLAAFVLAACGGSDTLPTVDCTTPAVPKYSELTIIANCTSCHDSNKMGAARLAAPDGVDYNTVEAARMHAETGVEQVFAKKMPYPDGSGVTEEQRTQFYRWGLCGTPN